MDSVMYAEYMKSKDWQHKRELFFASACFEGRCTACGKKSDSYHVHHMTYSRLGDELLTDLVALCKDCHYTLHEEHLESEVSLWQHSQQFIKLTRKENSLGPHRFKFKVNKKEKKRLKLGD